MTADNLAPDLQPGMQIGDYILDGQLARGGTSTVYAATHPLIGKRAAVKVLDACRAGELDREDRLVREARAINRLAHPNAIDVFACGQLDDGRSYLIMELLCGETLQRRCHRIQLSNEEIYEILIQLSDVLDTANLHDIAHLDLKPENVFLVPVHGGRTLVKLLDFGLASQVQPETLPQPGHSFRGTPEYASPEQALGLASIDHRSDIYSMGVVAFELFTGARPFGASTVGDLLHKQIHEEPARPSLLCAEIPASAEALILDMLAKSPGARPTAAEVRERLLTIRLSSLRCATLTMPPFEPPPNRRRQGVVAVAMLAVGLCALAWRYAWHPAPPEPAARELVAPAPEPTTPPVETNGIARRGLP